MNPVLHVYALCVLVLFIKMLAISCYQGFFRLRHLAFINSEDVGYFNRAANLKELPQVSRAARAWANDMENIPLFFVLGGLCSACVPTVCVFYAFTVARVMHTLMYLGCRQPWRTVAYGVGVVCLSGLGGMVGFRLIAIGVDT